MGIADSIAWWAMVLGSYIILWFLALFILLPIGQYEGDDAPGQFTPGAPVAPAREPSISLRTKFLWAAVIAAIGWLGLAVLAILKVIVI